MQVSDMHTTFETASTETSNILLLLTEGANVMVRMGKKRKEKKKKKRKKGGGGGERQRFIPVGTKKVEVQLCVLLTWAPGGGMSSASRPGHFTPVERTHGTHLTAGAWDSRY